ncbi:hypothetical protein DAPPUDRAFT_329314 [Daphnia pulex]|uniref:Uncharacterized protein n=1 Tax=Daphnia pulex TaxID=6669 RepID=E9HG93_DAPPU|nr:hypothetical protein DAPPUDRAFT_329314 [Daphnia pulex]|eukprot:EFX69241.1 hypothetical protein DAPPUDRAFT_329314 [Daphnia pulex]
MQPVKSSLGIFRIEHITKTVRFGQQGTVCVSLLNEEKPLVNVPSQSQTRVVISPEKLVSVNESIEYEEKSNYGFESESGKRRLDAGNNCKAKKRCGDICIADLFGDRRSSEVDHTRGNVLL